MNDPDSFQFDLEVRGNRSQVKLTADVAQLEEFYSSRGRGLQDFSSVGTLRQRQALKAALDELRADVVAEKARSRDLALGPPKCFTIGCYANP